MSSSNSGQVSRIEPLETWTDVPPIYKLPPNADIKSRNASNSKFLSLPAEVRFTVYSYALVYSLSITVWSAKSSLLHWPREEPHRLRWDLRAMTEYRQHISLGLLRCSTGVAADAARVFYSQNSFRFAGDHEYCPVVTWLYNIGKENRDSLRSLEMSVQQPVHAWQMPDGSRLKQYDLQFGGNGLSPRHPLFAPPTALCPEGGVDIIDPAIETIISLLAGASNSRKLTLYLDLRRYLIPGIELEEMQDMTLFSMDLPKLIEKWRVAYFLDPLSGPMEILWRAESQRSLFLEQRHLIEEVGWEILDETKSQHVRQRWMRPGEYDVFPTIRHKLRRRQLTGRLIASDPDPYTAHESRPRPR